MNNFITLDRCQACSVTGGAGNKEGRFARMLGRLVGAALRALYDLITSKKDPQVQPAG